MGQYLFQKVALKKKNYELENVATAQYLCKKGLTDSNIHSAPSGVYFQ
jgi:hypothetical protein